MKLPRAPAKYDAADQNRLRSALEQADNQNAKTDRWTQIVPGQRLVLYDDVTGQRGYLHVVSGTITWTTF